jgi:beta-lactamase superfamily II metal-dependent hydrolase
MNTFAPDSLDSATQRLKSRCACFAALVSIALLGFACFGSSQIVSAQSKRNADHLLIYSIDVEGGQATLLVCPSGGSLLVDTGWPGNGGRDAMRIETAMHDAGIGRIDRVLLTHYHVDHAGGVPDLLKRVDVGEFLDHGPNRETDNTIGTEAVYEAYLKAIAGHPHRVVRPGDTIAVPGLSIVVLTADGEHISTVLGITPVPNSYCASERAWPDDPSENARSAGILVSFGKFKFLDLGDLTGQKEVALVCPNDPIGTVDLYLTTHHGLDQSNSRPVVDAVHPRVAIMNNGAHKGGSPQAWQTVHDSPGLIDLWQLHTAEGSDAAHNSPDWLIANLKGDSDGAYLKVAASRDGSFSVTNTRTGQTKDYPRD